jgi:hypothetical protein
MYLRFALYDLRVESGEFGPDWVGCVRVSYCVGVFGRGASSFFYLFQKCIFVLSDWHYQDEIVDGWRRKG